MPSISMLELSADSEPNTVLQPTERDQFHFRSASAVRGTAEGLQQHPERKKQEPSEKTSLSSVQFIFLGLVAVW